MGRLRPPAPGALVRLPIGVGLVPVHASPLVWHVRASPLVAHTELAHALIEAHDIAEMMLVPHVPLVCLGR